MWKKKLLLFTPVIFLHINGWKLYIFLHMILFDNFYTFLSCQSWEFSWEHDRWFGWWSDVCCWTCTLGGSAENSECNTAIRYQLKNTFHCASSSVLYASLNLYLHSPGISGAASSDPDAGKCYGKLVHSCYSSTRFLFNLLIRAGVAGLGLGDILKPDLVLPLIENLPIEQLASHLPEVCTTEMICYPDFQINRTLQLNSWSLPNSRAHGLLVISLSFSKVLLCANN
jgi:hypothetical protein